MQLAPSPKAGPILITGAGGLLGANLALDYSRRGYQVLATGRGRLPKIDGVIAHQCDLTSADGVAHLFREYRPTYVIHCAAMTNVDQCQADPDQARLINVEMSRRLAEHAARLMSQLVYISTDSVFDGERGNYTEEDRPSPVNVYAQSKWEGETAVLTSLPSAVVVRTNIYGWNMQPKMSLAEWIIDRLHMNEEFPGFRDVFFSPILVNDLGDVILKILDEQLQGIFHVAGREHCSKYEFAVDLAAMFGLNGGLIRAESIENSTLRAPRPKNTSLKNERIERALGCSMPTLHEGVARFRHLRDNGFSRQLKQAGMAEVHA